MNSASVSIIVPCYNQAQYLDECLQSVLDQSYDNWECILVNDGSSDNTEEVAKKWVTKDKRFKYFVKENGGVSSTRNFGILNSTSTYILPLDGDDKIGSDYLKLGITEFENDKSLCLVYANAAFFGIINEFWNLPDFDFKKFLLNNCIYCSAIFKRTDFISTGGYDEKLEYGNEDWEFWINLISKYDMPKIKRLNYTGFFYRRKVMSRDVELCNDPIKQSKTLFEIYKKHHKLYDEYFGGYIHNLREIERDKLEIKKLLKSKKFVINLFTNKFLGLEFFKGTDSKILK